MVGCISNPKSRNTKWQVQPYWSWRHLSYRCTPPKTEMTMEKKTTMNEDISPISEHIRFSSLHHIFRLLLGMFQHEHFFHVNLWLCSMTYQPPSPCCSTHPKIHNPELTGGSPAAYRRSLAATFVADGNEVGTSWDQGNGKTRNDMVRKFTQNPIDGSMGRTVYFPTWNSFFYIFLWLMCRSIYQSRKCW